MLSWARTGWNFSSNFCSNFCSNFESFLEFLEAVDEKPVKDLGRLSKVFLEGLALHLFLERRDAPF